MHCLYRIKECDVEHHIIIAHQMQIQQFSLSTYNPELNMTTRSNFLMNTGEPFNSNRKMHLLIEGNAAA